MQIQIIENNEENRNNFISVFQRGKTNHVLDAIVDKHSYLSEFDLLQIGGFYVIVRLEDLGAIEIHFRAIEDNMRISETVKTLRFIAYNLIRMYNVRTIFSYITEENANVAKFLQIAVGIKKYDLVPNMYYLLEPRKK